VTEASTPNATIRRAADAIGLAAAGAKSSASGRWYVATPEGGYPQTVNESATVTLKANTFDEPGHPQSTSRFIASMDPVVAFGLAKLLNAVADADLAAAHAAAADLAVGYLRETRTCPACDEDIPITASGALVQHGTMAADCPGGLAR
jgi:hypothetical protein